MDLQTITAFLSQYGTWGILLAGVLTITSDKWLPWLKGKFTKGSADPADDEDLEVKELLALRLIQARGKRNKCPDFNGGLKKVEECWFHAVPAEAAK